MIELSRSHPGIAVVARVPHERDVAARTQHARDVGEGVVVVEPVERLRGDDDVGGAVGQRDRLGAPLERPNVGQHRRELRAHLVQRLDRGHTVAERDERAGQLARSGTEIDDVGRLVAHEPADGLLRVSGAPALVGAGDLRERRVRAAHLRIAVDDHRVECRPLPTRLVSTQPGDPARC